VLWLLLLLLLLLLRQKIYFDCCYPAKSDLTSKHDADIWQWKNQR